MDYLYFSTLLNCTLPNIVTSYDIACQWSLKIQQRLRSYPAVMGAENFISKAVTYLVPKFHLPAHISLCRTRYSYNFASNVGMTDGEGIERQWSSLNEYATSTREMGPGSRRDTLDDAFGDWNWKKVTSMGESHIMPGSSFQYQILTIFYSPNTALQTESRSPKYG